MGRGAEVVSGAHACMVSELLFRHTVRLRVCFKAGRGWARSSARDGMLLGAGHGGAPLLPGGNPSFDRPQGPALRLRPPESPWG